MERFLGVHLNADPSSKFDVRIVDEYRTSSYCDHCEHLSVGRVVYHNSNSNSNSNPNVHYQFPRGIGYLQCINPQCNEYNTFVHRDS